MLLGSKISTNLNVALVGANNSVSNKQNFVCSPLGIEHLLSIVANGSSSETRNQIFKFLGSESLNSINQKASHVLQIVSPERKPNPRGPIVSFVNGAWVDHHFFAKPAFQQVLEGTYEAEPKAVDFLDKEQVCSEINSWAKENTRGLIVNVLSPQFLKDDDIFILGNALYFKASWAQQFTTCKKDQFHLLNGETIDAPFMTLHKRSSLQGASFDEYKVLKFPYDMGDPLAEINYHPRQFSMYIILPNKRNGIVDLIQKFSEDDNYSSVLDVKLESLPQANVTELLVPKFKFSQSFSVKEALNQVRLDRMFQQVGELTEIVEHKGLSISDKMYYVSDFAQYSVIEVNEEGTEAASAAYISVRFGGFQPPNTFSFVADHPFMFMIREEVSGVTLFVGTVLNPTSN